MFLSLNAGACFMFAEDVWHKTCWHFSDCCFICYSLAMKSRVPIKVLASCYGPGLYLSSMSLPDFGGWFSTPFQNVRPFVISMLWCHVRWREAYGGVYADIDVEATKCFDPLLRAARNARNGSASRRGEEWSWKRQIGCLQKRVAETTE